MEHYAQVSASSKTFEDLKRLTYLKPTPTFGVYELLTMTSFCQILFTHAAFAALTGTESTMHRSSPLVPFLLSGFIPKLLKACALLIASCAVPALSHANDLSVEIDGVMNTYPVSSYSTNDRFGNQGSFSVDGGALTLNDVAWKSLTINHEVTPNTVLEFDFKSTGGKLSGIGVDSNTSPTKSLAFRINFLQHQDL